jgi:hypothetical protein
MAMCEQLEGSLSTTFTYRSRLLETLLNQALKQAGECEGHAIPVEAKAC